jgi:hypothetical protein
MDETKALSILSTLANGVNPLTGEAFPSDSPYQAPDIVRALYVATRALNARTGPKPARSGMPSNVGKPWTAEEDQRLLAEFDRGREPRALAGAHGRTLAGIEARLEKLGRISSQQRVTTNRYGGEQNKPNGNGRTTQR